MNLLKKSSMATPTVAAVKPPNKTINFNAMTI
jgi:hypothetical protein